MNHTDDQLDAAFRATEGYSTLATSFHPELRERIETLVHAARTFPPVDLVTDQLPPVLDPLAHELAVRAATDSTGTYVVWDQFPELNWPVPVGYTPERISRWLVARWSDRCGWCGRGATADGLLAGAGCAVALLSFCKGCRYQLAEECNADLFWI